MASLNFAVMIGLATGFVLIAVLPVITARFCSHSSKGICEVPDLRGWCFHDKTTGQFDCDDDGFCANQTALQGKIQIAGCFSIDGEFKCCCNKGHLCNQVLTHYAPVSNITQKCNWGTHLNGQDALSYPDCDGEWCYTFISSDKAGSPTNVQKGCEARSLLMHQQTKAMDQQFNNASSWAYSEPLWNAPRCSEIVAAADYAIGKNATEIGDMEGQTASVCLDMEFMQKGVPSKGKVCCCRGNATCNEDIGWGDPAITMTILDAYRRDHGGIVSNSASIISVISGLIVLAFSLV